MAETANAAVQINLFRISNPLTVQVIENWRLTAKSRGKKNDVRHIVFRCPQNYPALPGQSAGILPPGLDPKTGKPYSPRLYSLASPTGGEDGTTRNLSLCVVRHFWENSEIQTEVPGIASNYLCDLKAGDSVKITGPVGKHFLLPEDYKQRDIIFIATGTGIAPFRGMLIDMFAAGYSRKVWLILGVQYEDCLLYEEEFLNFAKKHSSFTYLKAISREQTNPFPNEVPTRQNRMYVQVKMFEKREALVEILSRPESMIYLCGLKGMEEGIFPILGRLGSRLGVGDSFAAKLKAEGRLKVEVY